MRYILLLTCLIMGHQSRGKMEFQCETIEGQDRYEYLKEEIQISVNKEYDASILRRLAFCQLDPQYNKMEDGLRNLRNSSSMGDVSASQTLGDIYRVGGTTVNPISSNHRKSIKWYEDVLQKINKISDYPNRKLTSLCDNEVRFKNLPSYSIEFNSPLCFSLLP